MPMDCIDYFELKAVWVKGCRNGNIQKLNPFERGFFRACLTYTKINGPIISKKIIEMIRSLIDILTMTPRREALKQGFEKVKTLIKNINLIGMFPKILDWVGSLDYILYLGFMEINKPEYMKVY
jgi:hypothetical protein